MLHFKMFYICQMTTKASNAGVECQCDPPWNLGTSLDTRARGLEGDTNRKYLPPANEVWGRVIFLHLCVILFLSGRGVCPTPWKPTPLPWMQAPYGCRNTLDADPVLDAETPSTVQSASGRYASYWYAYLSFIFSEKSYEVHETLLIISVAY